MNASGTSEEDQNETDRLGLRSIMREDVLTPLDALDIDQLGAKAVSPDHSRCLRSGIFHVRRNYFVWR